LSIANDTYSPVCGKYLSLLKERKPSRDSPNLVSSTIEHLVEDKQETKSVTSTDIVSLKMAPKKPNLRHEEYGNQAPLDMLEKEVTAFKRVSWQEVREDILSGRHDSKDEAEAKAKAEEETKAAEKAAAEKAMQEEEEELERQIREMEEAEERREKEEAELLRQRATEKAKQEEEELERQIREMDEAEAKDFMRKKRLGSSASALLKSPSNRKKRSSARKI
jgi:translation initiation factor 4G